MLGRFSRLPAAALLDAKGALATAPVATATFPLDKAFVTLKSCSVCTSETRTIAPMSTVNSMFVFVIIFIFTLLSFSISNHKYHFLLDFLTSSFNLLKITNPPIATAASEIIESTNEICAVVLE